MENPIEVLIINGCKAVYRYKSGFTSFNATAKLGFCLTEDADYFIEHYKGQFDYKEAMQPDKEVVFSVFFGGQKDYEDVNIKPIGWKNKYIKLGYSEY